MKWILFFLILTANLALVSCKGIETVCGYQKDYGKPHYQNPKCGPNVNYRCDYVCDHCLAREPECGACWTCLNKN